MSLIFIHELGHFFAAKYYNWNTDKIYVYPLGGITKFNDSINRSLVEEFVIVLMGPIFQMIYFFILFKLGVKDITLFNFTLLLFNLLPIYPLDGGKLINVFFAFILPCRIGYKVTIFISFLFYFIMLFLFIFFSSSFFFLIVFFFLLFKVIEEASKSNYYFNKFLLERYLEKFYFKRIKYVSSVYSMYRNRIHYFYCNGSWITEKEMLKRYFK